MHILTKYKLGTVIAHITKSKEKKKIVACKYDPHSTFVYISICTHLLNVSIRYNQAAHYFESISHFNIACVTIEIIRTQIEPILFNR